MSGDECQPPRVKGFPQPPCQPQAAHGHGGSDAHQERTKLQMARFPAYKDLSGFDFAASEINEATVRQLHRGELMEGAQNVVLIGGPGTGKTHVATALGIQSIEQHRRRVRFFSTIELVNALEQEKTRGEGRTDCRKPQPPRSRDPGRAGLSDLQCIRRRFVSSEKQSPGLFSDPSPSIC